MATRMDPYGLIGTTIGQRYSVDFFVGVGRFSVVYRGTQLDTLRPVALKFLKVRSDLAPRLRPSIARRIDDSAAALRDVAQHCPTFCEVIETSTVVTADGRWVPFLVQGWLEGVPLESMLVREALNGERRRTLNEAIELLAPVADALGYAHARGVIHGGLAPRSLYLREATDVEWRIADVLDLGLAQLVGAAQSEDRAFSGTNGPLFCFAPAYGAPEQFSVVYGELGPWTDVFALALIVVELITGRSPLGDGDDAQLERASREPSRRPTPRALGADVGPFVEAVFERALAVDPDDRYASITVFWEALRAAHRVTLLPAMGSPASSRAPSFDREGIVPEELIELLPSEPSLPDPVSEPSLPVSEAPFLLVPPSGAPPAYTIDTPPESLVPPPRVSRSRWFARGFIVAAAAGLAVGAGYVKLQGARPAAASGEARPEPMSLAMPAPVETRCPDGMIKVAGGHFYMGADEDTAGSKPAHGVTLAPYCIDAFQVTAARYQKCSDDGQCKRPARDNDWKGITARDHRLYDPLCNGREPGARGQHPMNCVSYDMAQSFCSAQGSRLPTEAEWELAARGRDGRRYPWGDEEPSAKRLNACGKECVAWAKARGLKPDAMFAEDDGWPTTAPVGSFTAGDSPFGMHDAVGNVREWTNDFYADYTSASQTDPKGPAVGTDRVTRGTAWNGTNAQVAHSAFRSHESPDARRYAVGFRCARSLDK